MKPLQRSVAAMLMIAALTAAFIIASRDSLAEPTPGAPSSKSLLLGRVQTTGERRRIGGDT